MTYSQRKNIKYRLIGTGFLLLSLAAMIMSLIHLVNVTLDEKILYILAIIIAIVFLLAEVFFLLKGWKKDLNLYNIAFNSNGVINNVPLFGVIIGTIFGCGLSALGICLFFIKREEPAMSISLLILAIGSYLLVNCIIYFIYVLMYKNRQMKLKDLIK